MFCVFANSWICGLCGRDQVLRLFAFPSMLSFIQHTQHIQLAQAQPIEVSSPNPSEPSDPSYPNRPSHPIHGISFLPFGCFCLRSGSCTRGCVLSARPWLYLRSSACDAVVRFIMCYHVVSAVPLFPPSFLASHWLFAQLNGSLLL